MTQEQRAVAIETNSDRTSRRFGVLMFIMAVSSLAMNAFSGVMSGLRKLLRVFWAIGAAGMFLHTSFNFWDKGSNETIPTGPGPGQKEPHELSFPTSSNAFLAIVWGGLACGVFDITQAMVGLWYLQNWSRPPTRYSSRSLQGCWAEALFRAARRPRRLGAFLHFFIAFHLGGDLLRGQQADYFLTKSQSSQD